jgi:hypothetical protein
MRLEARRTWSVHRTFRTLTLAAAAVVPIALPAAMVSSAAAAGPLPSTTTLAASPTAVTQPTDTVALTATVKILGLPGLGITPTGKVTFSDSAGSLGSASIGSCFLTVCTAKLSVPSANLPTGTVPITAAFAGDTFATASSGSASITVTNPAPPGTPDNPLITTCGSGDCNTGTVSDAAGDTSLVTDASSQNGVTITSSLGGAPLPCSVPGAGDVANVNETSGGGVKNITYTLTGSAAEAMFQWLNENEGVTDWTCYDANTPFTAFYSATGQYPDTHFPAFGSFGTVPQVTSGPYAGTYAGLLTSCGTGVNETPVPPCQTGYQFTFDSTNTVATSLTIGIQAPAGDPHLGGGG